MTTINGQQWKHAIHLNDGSFVTLNDIHSWFSNQLKSRHVEYDYVVRPYAQPSVLVVGINDDNLAMMFRLRYDGRLVK